jgi:hypothetical protein
MFVFFLDYQEIIKGFFVFIRLSDIDEILCLYTKVQDFTVKLNSG